MNETIHTDGNHCAVLSVQDAPPIKAVEKPSWDTVFTTSVADCGEALVPLSLAPERYLVRPAYHAAGIPGALSECYARDGVRKRLLIAQDLLPSNLRLIILDTWRSVEVQTSLFTQCKASLKRVHSGLDDEALENMTSRFVALPSLDERRPSPHVTGGAVDLALATTDGSPLWFGASFDYPGPVSYTRHFEELLEQGETLDVRENEALHNRRLLHHVMLQAGFVNYHGEWWHYEYGTQRWAYIKGLDEAKYSVSKPNLNPFESFAQA
ncbi:M15 family metallopeptidase [Desulfovibrio ferrophilus]|uniref:D-alanyl-D-alanine dipeptidase n=1 Tax=Desulfovibrio ferrophilus TaxID=241368 RepID=A0A2Z6B2N3_9BACT|nr:M15 family metallopeptidase [Desulfovibrio ferrophilus]BBD09777.1 peptidase M15D vanX D-ala-D-ala dipeptidase [Desulfovibrio ferrophilus]